MKVIPETRHTH